MPALDSSILVAFLEAGDQPVSGDRLAKELGISRVAVWSRLERLRAAGFTFKASTRKGYILTDVPRELNAAWLGAQLRRRKVAPEVELLAEVDSTNSEAERRLATGQEAPFAVLARAQSAGRGRLDRKFDAPASSALMFSLYIEPQREKSDWSFLPLLTGLSAIFALMKLEPASSLTLKWPNDILLGDGKVGGIIVQVSGDGVIIGVGINVGMTEEELPVPHATSLALHQFSNLDRNVLLSTFLTTFEECLNFLLHDFYEL